MTIFLTIDGKYRNTVEKFMYVLSVLKSGEKRKYQLMCDTFSSSKNLDAILKIAKENNLIIITSIERNRNTFRLSEKGKRLIEVWLS